MHSFNAFYCFKIHHLQDDAPIEDRRYGTRYTLLTSKIGHRKSQLKKRLMPRRSGIGDTGRSTHF